MAAIGIIGFGIVGKGVAVAFSQNTENKILWYDKKIKGKHSFNDVVNKSEFIFVCLPTPMLKNGEGIDLSIMNEVIDKIAKLTKNTKKLIVIKSTVVPTTTINYSQKYPNVQFSMVPEFLTEVNAEWDSTHPSRIVIGVENEANGVALARLHRLSLGYDFPIFITDTKTAEMVKYMSNCFMAVKTIFANEMSDLANKININYDEVKKMVGIDKRIGESFLGVSPFGGYGLKCFPKDTVALLGLAKKLKVDLSILDSAWQKNLKIRKIKDWEGIEGAVSS